MLISIFKQAKVSGQLVGFMYHNKPRLCEVREVDDKSILTNCYEEGSTELSPMIKRFKISEMENLRLFNAGSADLLT